ncbi:unnamed protein product [Musa acuminata subsp. malaccensis]|uniref:(wild Malaysian banana) hypothetical protein n=1 Tax=Musa acuminata subsp. malaccensis TaxID=214687 RepID=A0A804KF58_MUSAM|nr:PREDICTED: uncharacterized protein LOC103996784 [Musa acuminata subsp. malaccensis]CAG1834006.1 unnamed protein product [Musa acuminata subsp. malaccensis]
MVVLSNSPSLPINSPPRSLPAFFLPPFFLSFHAMGNEATDEKKPLLSPLASGKLSLSLRRRGVTLPAVLDIVPAHAAAAGRRWPKDIDYTSLRDIMSSTPPPSGMASPTTPGAPGCGGGPGGGGGGEIRIRNRLVQQAAHAYLQLTPRAAAPPPRGLLRRALAVLSCADLLSPCLHFFRRLFRSLCRLG